MLIDFRFDFGDGMKNNWELKKLGEVCEYDKIPNKKNNLPYVGLEDIESNTGRLLCEVTPKSVKSSTFNFTSEHLLYGRLRPYLNKVLLPDFEGHCSTEIFPIKPKETLNRKFLFHWITSEEIVNKINSTWTGATLPRANMNAVLDFEITLPPLAEQQRIVAILDEAFAAIAQAKENAEKNLQNARELFDSYLQSVFANPGNGWEEKTLGETCILRSGTTLPPKVEKSEGDLPYLKVADMNLEENIGNIKTSSRFVNFSDISANGIIPIGSTIFPKRGGAILTNKKRITSTKICMDLNLMAVTPKNEIHPDFLHFYFLGVDLRNINNGSSIPQINNYQIEPLKIAFPTSLTEQQNIVSKLDALSAETKKLENIYRQKINDLDELKKSILQKAFNGELS